MFATYCGLQIALKKENFTNWNLVNVFFPEYAYYVDWENNYQYNYLGNTNIEILFFGNAIANTYSNAYISECDATS